GPLMRCGRKRPSSTAGQPSQPSSRPSTPDSFTSPKPRLAPGSRARIRYTTATARPAIRARTRRPDDPSTMDTASRKPPPAEGAGPHGGAGRARAGAVDRGEAHPKPRHDEVRGQLCRGTERPAEATEGERAHEGIEPRRRPESRTAPGAASRYPYPAGQRAA